MRQANKKKLIDVRLNKPNKFEARRGQLAQSTLVVMGRKGYAKTSMRDIATEAGVSLGTLHYYFVDKSELLTYCVKTFKQVFIQNVIDECESATNFDELITTFCDVCCDSMIDAYDEHRVWFDIRAQALYEPIFAPLRKEIEKELEVMFRTLIVAGEQFSGHTVGIKTDAAGMMFEGLFENQLFNYIDGQDAAQAKADLEHDFRDFCDQLFTTEPGSAKAR